MTLRQKLKKEGIFVEDGLLWRIVGTMESDEIAQRHGYVYVERLITAVEEEDLLAGNVPRDTKLPVTKLPDTKLPDSGTICHHF